MQMDKKYYLILILEIYLINVLSISNTECFFIVSNTFKLPETGNNSTRYQPKK
jgi:hypothetical protein